MEETNTRYHGGNTRELARMAGCGEDELIDFSANINPLGPPACVRAVISRTVERLSRYPDRECRELIDAIASAHGCSPENLVAGNGSTELIHALPRVLSAVRAVIPVPAYGDYAGACRLGKLPVDTMALEAHDDFVLDLDGLERRLRGDELVFIGQPNNPTAQLVDRASIVRLARRASSSYFVVDESFADFVDGYTSLIGENVPNVIVVKSLTKFYGIPGVRLGFIHAPHPIVEGLGSLIPTWSVNVFAQATGVACLRDHRYARRTREIVGDNRRRQHRRLQSIDGLTVWPGVADFLLLRIDKTGFDGPRMARALLRERIAVRVCDSFDGLDERYIRVAIRTDTQNRELAECMAEVLGSHRRHRTPRRPTPALMFQGTSSNAGKSVLAAALCRIMVQDGIRVAPFKAQNMSLNSFVTADGGEMGRAQVVQAQACRLAPDVRMNPVLLKPNSDTGSQVIVRGKVAGSMRVGEYVSYKPTAFKAVKECYDSLAGDFDAIVLEGAGSPGEINLKHHDIVNMAMASYANSPVALVGDIDRGGVFASFIGTMETLAQWERKMVAGFVVNRFRGDPSLLESAFTYTRNHTGKSILGIVPYIAGLGLPEEDSVTFKCGGFGNSEEKTAAIAIGVVDLPHISNFTDFDALRLEPDVCLKVVCGPGDLEGIDAVVLPGSKNVPADMRWVEQSGCGDRLRRLGVEGNVDIVGICGGYQMLGTRIADPLGLESRGDAIPGLGLLHVTTELGYDKILTRTEATHTVSGCRISGYEIHHGRSSHEECAVMFTTDSGEIAGIGTTDQRIWGTYLHGVFDSDPFRRWFIDRLRSKGGLAPLEGKGATYDIESALDRLAGIVRSSLDIPSLYRTMGLQCGSNIR